ncbi:MAG: hypothetical protein IT488_14765 [Gammaproteobacteria bacterium]|nr:hypothetical protein [Gammaproteobacteria bacterium]
MTAIVAMIMRMGVFVLMAVGMFMAMLVGMFRAVRVGMIMFVFVLVCMVMFMVMLMVIFHGISPWLLLLVSSIAVRAIQSLRKNRALRSGITLPSNELRKGPCPGLVLMPW